MRKRVRLGRWRFVLLLALTSVLTLAAFGTALRNGFAYDDEWTIVANRHLESPLGSLMAASWRGEARRMHIPDATRPAMIASTWVDRRLFGLAPAGYHADSLWLGALTAAAAGLCAFAVVRRWRMAVTAAALFAVAPLHTEVVASINNREDALAAIGVLTALAVTYWPTIRPPPRWLAVARPIVAAAAWGLALAAKESAVVLAPIAALAWWWRGRGRGWLAAHEPTLMALVAVGLVWSSWRVGLRFGGDDVPVAHGVSVLQRLLRAARYEAWATASEIFPWTAIPEREHAPPAGPAWVLVTAALVAAVVFLWRRRATRALAFGLATAMLAPFASSPLVGPANEQADRYLFLGVLGGAMMWAWAFEQLRRRAGRRVALGGVAVVIVACVILSTRAAEAWHDNLAFWTEAARVAPGSARAWGGLSRATRLSGDIEEALKMSQRAIDLDPTYASGRMTHGYNLVRAGRPDEALEHFLYVKKHAPDTYGLTHALDCVSMAPIEAAACIDAP